MTSAGKVETEQKYDAGTSTPLPELLEIPCVERVAEPVLDHLEAVYFDTPTLALAARRITLRRRTGGADHGWHLKLPVGAFRRQEIHAPLGQPDTVPEELASHLHIYTRGEDLVPIARLTTQRTTYRLYGSGGEHLADFADDRVHAQALHPVHTEQHWREWEIELVHGADRLFAAAEETLSATGAVRSAHAAKLARALGGAWPPERVPATPEPQKKGPAADVVTTYLHDQITELFTHDPGVRRETPDAIHQMRSATRRARSALTTYRPLFDKPTVKKLADDLKWLARILGQARDAEVMRERLRHHLGDMPENDSAGPFPAPLERELDTAYNSGYRKALQALDSGRYHQLLTGLENFRDHPPTRARASKPARAMTARLVDKTTKRLNRARKAAERTTSWPERDTALHQVRKDAKRLRHAAESVTSIHGKRARKLAKAAKRLQQILGDHQDSVLARDLLTRLAAAPEPSPETALTYARLLTNEKRITRNTETAYRKAARKNALTIRLRH
ncbi:CYTH and CHAD domain-containing protein [Arthrobacter sp. 24S4-2]|uniref:CYTH and CHAD domain-containing protein n=1 Tax=Arthrobacter sp. 24S4-2 TaxID=2575374 RepID=UPI0010C79D7D|nr:CYTH and CHAD domain-containing protein [Arthrobacter sp. 24S4-2]QCO98363.1 CYTH and CHAD domain-containing protein [Arthrobacter sp. 24S4-2]